MLFRLVDFFSSIVRPRDPFLDSLGQQVDSCLHDTFRTIEEARRRGEERHRLTSLQKRVSDQEEVLRLLEKETLNRKRFRDLQQRFELTSSETGL